jgi:hypothetical protein
VTVRFAHRSMPLFPSTGSVLGIDVGYSPTRRTSAVCRLDWTEESVSWAIRRFCAVPRERDDVLMAVASDVPLQGAALDRHSSTNLPSISQPPESRTSISPTISRQVTVSAHCRSSVSCLAT